MPTFINKLPGGLSIDGANGHTYHIDGSQSIEITDDDVVAMRGMGAFKLLEAQGSVVIEGVAEPKKRMMHNLIPRKTLRFHRAVGAVLKSHRTMPTKPWDVDGFKERFPEFDKTADALIKRAATIYD